MPAGILSCFTAHSILESPDSKSQYYAILWGTWIFYKLSQSAIICSKLTIETLEQGVKYV